MSAHERTGVRSLVYSGWHREHNIKKYLGDLRARFLTMCDIDSLEYCSHCKRPLALIETCRGHANSRKENMPMMRLSSMAKIPAYIVVVEIVNDQPECFHVRKDGRLPQKTLSPQQFAEFLWRIHAGCRCIATQEIYKHLNS